MKINLLEQNIIAAQDRLRDWLKQIMAVAPTSDQICEATEEILVAMEELGVAVEELYQQQEQLQVANLKMAEERQRYLELFEFAPDGYLISDCEGVIQEANLTAMEMLKRPQKFLVGKPLSIFITQSERRRFFRVLQRLRQEEVIKGVEFCLQPTNGLPFSAAIAIAPVRDEQDQLVGFRWLLRDVTQLKEAEAEAQRQRERSQFLAEITLKIRQSWQLEEILQTAVTESQKLLNTESVLIFRLESGNSATVIAEASSINNFCLSDQKFTCAFLPNQYTAETPGKNLFGVSQIIPEYYFQPATNQTQLTEISPLLELTNLVVPIYIRQRLWGFLTFHRCPAYRTESPIPNSPIPQFPSTQWEDFEIDLGEELANQIGIAVAQTQFIRNMEELVSARTNELRESNHKLQKEIEERLRVEELLRRSKEQLYLTADSLPILISYVDSQRYYRFSNKAYEAWVGKSVKEIFGSPMEEVLGESLYKQIEDQVETVLSGQEVVFEIQIPYQDEGLRWVNLTFIPHRNKSREILGFFALIEDISDRKAIEKIKNEFISVVSHELRTPLTSIHGSLRLLNSGRMGFLNNKSQQLIGIAERNTDRLVRLVNDILDIQRMDSGKITLEKQPCNAAELISTAVATMKELARQQEISLECTSISIPLVADPDSILQTITNLLGNAIKFSPAKTTIWVQVENRDTDILFQVRDQGRGIPPDKLETIFERFQQVDVSDSHQKQGTGLGLAICRQIIELHQGKIWVESILGKGSTFYFTLPK